MIHKTLACFLQGADQQRSIWVQMCLAETTFGGGRMNSYIGVEAAFSEGVGFQACNAHWVIWTLS